MEDINDLIRSALTAEEQSDRSETLTKINDVYLKTKGELETNKKELENFKNENAKLKDQNMNLFTRVNIPVTEEQKPKEEKKEKKQVTLKDLFA